MHREQLRAVQFLQKLGYKYLSAEEVAVERCGDFQSVLLRRTLTAQIQRINRVGSPGEMVDVSMQRVEGAIAVLEEAAESEVPYNQARVYRLLLGGEMGESSVGVETKRSRIRFIDWSSPLNNAFHVTTDFCVQVGDHLLERFLNVVCFVNGLPLVLIECATMGEDRGFEDVMDRIEQFQKMDKWFPLFAYCQVLLGLDEAEGGHLKAGPTTGDWVRWGEVEGDSSAIIDMVNSPPAVADHHKLFFRRDALLKAEFEREVNREKQVTDRDRILWELCRPKPLVDCVRQFVSFDQGGGIKRFACYSQYRFVAQLKERVTKRRGGSRRKGGFVRCAEVLDRIQLMLFLGRSLVMDSVLGGCHVLFVSDREDFLDWIEMNFDLWGGGVQRVTSWRELNAMSREGDVAALTMDFNSFENAQEFEKGSRVLEEELTVLVERGQRDIGFDSVARIKTQLPNVCFLMFSAVPPTQDEKPLVDAVGGFVKSLYRSAYVHFGRGIVPAYYENRSFLEHQSNQAGCSISGPKGGSFEGGREGGVSESCRLDPSNITERRLVLIADDLSDHYFQLWKGTRIRALAVVRDESEASRLKSILDRVGKVRSEIAEVVGSAGTTESDRILTDPLEPGWEPEILVVHEKQMPFVITSQDRIVYVIRELVGNVAAEAVMCLKRGDEGKDFALLIDYSTRSMDSSGCPKFAEVSDHSNIVDPMGSVVDIESVVGTLRERLNSIWALLSQAGGGDVDERFELLLADPSVRSVFYEAFFKFHRALLLAYSSSQWMEETPEQVIRSYHNALYLFQALRLRVANRYALELDHRVYETSLRKVIELRTNDSDLPLILGPMNRFVSEALDSHLEELVSLRAKADTIAYQMLRVLSGKLSEDPFSCREFSDHFHQAITARRSDEIGDQQYLTAVSRFLRTLRQSRKLLRNESGEASSIIVALADVAKRTIGSNLVDRVDETELRFLDSTPIYELDRPSHRPWDLWNILIAKQVLRLIQRHETVAWKDRIESQNRLRNEVDDYLFDLQEKSGILFTVADMDEFIEGALALFLDSEDRFDL